MHDIFVTSGSSRRLPTLFSGYDTESFQPGIGSKSKPCTKFFSTSGCPFGEGCHFLHYVPGGINAVSHMSNLGNPTVRSPMAALSHSDGPLPPPAVKTRMCNKYGTTEGCKFGDKCHFAHGERELGMPILPTHGLAGSRSGGGGWPDPTPPTGHGVAASFGASATAKISVDASLAGAIIGKGGVNTKQICRITGAKLAIREHEADSTLRNIELEGTFDQIKQASAMVRELILNLTAGTPLPSAKAHAAAAATGLHSASSNYKTKMCENFGKGSCTFGARCHFAHGAADLRKPPI
ncbi:unnamed protein product [Spirodela intermedia]|uniref:C3H1-type domain-containing protein n=1 Tax=Spirodela intermedia TaxID=51605 RepID=A0A7I8LAY8_SPIIN|nr:unnamed protein product [Spirodela intermedia]